MTKRTYGGSCHCGAVRFRFTSEPIATGCRCNCSICVRKGVVMSSAYISRADFEELEGLDGLAVYHFGDRLVNHYFCKVCGIFPFHDATVAPESYRVNLGCIDEIDLLGLEVELLDGKSF